ncbi:MAG TPA: hypothetical protein VGG61_08925 [Gemmataceae bacterium]
MTTISMDVAATVARCLSARRPSPATMTIFGAGGDFNEIESVTAAMQRLQSALQP